MNDGAFNEFWKRAVCEANEYFVCVRIYMNPHIIAGDAIVDIVTIVFVAVASSLLLMLMLPVFLGSWVKYDLMFFY